MAANKAMRVSIFISIYIVKNREFVLIFNCFSFGSVAAGEDLGSQIQAVPSQRRVRGSSSGDPGRQSEVGLGLELGFLDT
jgi:hypothetical protein